MSCRPQTARLSTFTSKYPGPDSPRFAAGVSRGRALENGVSKELSEEERARVWGPAAELLASDFELTFLRAAEEVCSPIEEIFLAALVACERTTSNRTLVCKGGMEMCLRSGDDADTLRIEPQARIGPYRVDFLIKYHFTFSKTDVSVVVELDGHEFHEKSKSQVARDKKRDRYITSQGLHVLRFTGAEVFHQAPQCAAETLDFLSDQMSSLVAASI